MFRVQVGDKEYSVKDGTRLSDFFVSEGISAEHPCGGKGICRKCRVRVNGEWVLSCEYEIHSDITVQAENHGDIMSPTGISVTGETGNEQVLVLDAGTTTLVLCSADALTGEITKIVTRPNPQRQMGADIMSRILCCMSGKTPLLQQLIADEISLMLEEFSPADRLFVTGNTTMLHLLFGIDPSGMGTYPYTPAFLGSRTISGAEAGINALGELISLPAASAFIGADIVSGLYAVNEPAEGKYNLLIDLGTNAEIVLFGEGEALCTSAAAGPCFEGVGISCGMSATEGAIYSYRAGSIKAVGNVKPTGVCATGLIDAVAFLLSSGIIDCTGLMAEGEYEIAEGVTLENEDIRQLQSAKAAVCAAVLCLMKIRGICADDIDTVFVSGGFSSHLSVESAVRIGLIPRELENKCRSMGNTALKGAVSYALGHESHGELIESMTYTDLSANADFSRLFIDNMMFPRY